MLLLGKPKCLRCKVYLKKIRCNWQCPTCRGKFYKVNSIQYDYVPYQNEEEDMTVRKSLRRTESTLYGIFFQKVLYYFRHSKIEGIE